MPYYRESVSHDAAYWCPNCKAWYRRDPKCHTRCLVVHLAGSCCHHGEILVLSGKAMKP